MIYIRVGFDEIGLLRMFFGSFLYDNDSTQTVGLALDPQKSFVRCA